MSAPVPDIDDLLFNMDLLHQQLVQKGMIPEKSINSFRESLDKLPEEKKLEKVQRRIQLITATLSESTPTSSFPNGGEISEKSPVQSQSNSLAPVQVKQEFPHPAAGFASNFAASLGREKFTARTKQPQTQPFNSRLTALRNLVFHRWWCYDHLLKNNPPSERRRLKIQDLYDAYKKESPMEPRGMKPICLQSSFKNRNMNKTELDDAVKHGDIRRATICVGLFQWNEPPDCGSETGTLDPEYNALDKHHWIEKAAVCGVRRSRKTKPQRGRTACQETMDESSGSSDSSDGSGADVEGSQKGTNRRRSRHAAGTAGPLASGGSGGNAGGSGGNAAGGGGAADGTVDSTAHSAAGAAPANKDGGAGATDGGAGAKDGGAGATYGGAGATDCGTGATDGGAGAAPPLDSASSGGNAAGGGRGGGRAAAGGGGVAGGAPANKDGGAGATDGGAGAKDDGAGASDGGPDASQSLAPPADGGADSASTTEDEGGHSDGVSAAPLLTRNNTTSAPVATTPAADTSVPPAPDGCAGATDGGPDAAEPPATPANGGVGGSSTPEARARRKKGDSGNGSATPLMRNDTTSAPVDGGPCGQSNSGHRPPCSPFH